MSDHDAIVLGRSRRLSAIWIVPLVAVVLGAWMVGYSYYSEGPVIDIHFDTAAGIEAGKTKIRALDVEVGMVESVRFAEDFEGVLVEARIEKFAEALLREDSEFWVVRPRVGGGEISGLGTIVSGAFIDLAPGTGPSGRRSYEGLADPPVTPAGTPGLNLTLVSDRGGSIGTGDAVSFRGIPVGKVENVALDLEQSRVRYRVFIEAPYDSLVTTATRFWNASGISFNASASGISFGTESLQSLIAGGVSFDLPTGVTPGEPVLHGAQFELHPNRTSIDLTPYTHYAEFVVSFTQSLRGLLPGAPVEMRGIRVGTVERILMQQRAQSLDARGKAFPVLIRIEPGRFQLGDTREGVNRVNAIIPQAVNNGMRAKLQSGNLITGSLVVALDYFPEAEPAFVGKYSDYNEIPTIPGGLQRLEQQLATLIDKVNALPLDSIGDSLDSSLQRLDGTLAAATQTLDGITRLMDQESTQTLPTELAATLVELRRVLAGYSTESALYNELHGVAFEVKETLTTLEALTRTLEAQPNAIIFGRKVRNDPEPRVNR